MPLWFVVVLYLSVRAFACLGKCRSYGAQSAFVRVYPGFHIGLCPYFTLGYAGVSPRWGSLHAFAVSPGFHFGLRPYFTLGCAGVSPRWGSLTLLLFSQGFISGFALISPWAMRECRPCRAHCRIGRLRCCVVVLCSLNVFGVCQWIVVFVFLYLFDCDCMGCGEGLW